tara:strand:- start:214 stop:807 length:594 start_codon:yes stop_codon:yes gene_type:complete
MINPAEVKNYNRTESELEEFLLFCINVAGKKSAVEAPKLEAFLRGARELEVSPFEWIRLLKKDGGLKSFMQAKRIAPYRDRYDSYVDVIKLSSSHSFPWKSLRDVTLEELMKVRGIGMKTARFFLSNTRKDFDEPMLDTHIMSYLRDEGHKDAPKTTPQNPKVYAKWSAVFSEKARQARKSVRELDIQIWKEYSKTS